MTLAIFIELHIRHERDKHGLWASDNHAQEIKAIINAMTNLELIFYIDLFRETYK